MERLLLLSSSMCDISAACMALYWQQHFHQIKDAAVIICFPPRLIPDPEINKRDVGGELVVEMVPFFLQILQFHIRGLICNA